MPNEANIRIEADSKPARDAFDSAGDSARGFTNTARAATSDLGRMAKQALIFFGIWKTASEIKDFIKDSSTLAARVETLGVVSETVGRTAGYSSEQIRGYVQAVKDQGITTQVSNQATVRMIQAHIDLTNASKLARIAQDAAVIGNINSSEALDRMTHALATSQVRLLHTIGIMGTFEEEEKKLADSIGKTVDQLTDTERMQGRVNMIIERGKDIAGAYESAMGTVGKQLTSLPRYIEEVELRFGEAFKPALGVIILEIASALKITEKNMSDAEAAAGTRNFARNLADSVQTAIRVIGFLGGLLVDGTKLLWAHRDALLAVSIAYGTNLVASSLAAGRALSNLIFYVRNLGFVLRYLAVTALPALANPLSWVAIGVGALAYAFLQAKGRADDFRHSLDEAREAAKTFSMEQATNEVAEMNENLEFLEKQAKTLRENAKTAGPIDPFGVDFRAEATAANTLLAVEKEILLAKARREAAQNRINRLESEAAALAAQRAAEEAKRQEETATAAAKNLADKIRAETDKARIAGLPALEQVDEQGKRLLAKLQGIANARVLVEKWVNAEKERITREQNEKIISDLEKAGATETELVLISAREKVRAGASLVDTTIFTNTKIAEIEERHRTERAIADNHAARNAIEREEALSAKYQEVAEKRGAMLREDADYRARLQGIEAAGPDPVVRLEKEYEARRRVLDLALEENIARFVSTTEETERIRLSLEYKQIQEEIAALDTEKELDIMGKKIDAQERLNALKREELFLLSSSIDAGLSGIEVVARGIEGGAKFVENLREFSETMIRDQDPVFAEIARQREAHFATVAEQHRQGLASQEEMDRAYHEAVSANEQATAMNKVQAAATGFGMLSSMATAFYAASGEKSKAAFNLMKGFQIAETIINTYKAAVAAYSALAGIPIVGPALGAAAAAAAIAFGMAQVRAIIAAKPGGGTPSIGGAVGGRGGGAAAAPPEFPEPEEKERAPQVINITVNGYVDLDRFAREIVPSLSKAIADGAE